MSWRWRRQLQPTDRTLGSRQTTKTIRSPMTSRGSPVVVRLLRSQSQRRFCLQVSDSLGWRSRGDVSLCKWLDVPKSPPVRWAFRLGAPGRARVIEGGRPLHIRQGKVLVEWQRCPGRPRIRTKPNATRWPDEQEADRGGESTTGHLIVRCCCKNGPIRSVPRRVVTKKLLICVAGL